jgi:hypothetical protein
VEVELLAVAPEHEANRKAILVQPEAERLERFVDSRNVAERNHQIEVFVRPAFAPKKRVDTPPTVERCLDPARLKNSQELEDSVGGHFLSWCGLTDGR